MSIEHHPVQATARKPGSKRRKHGMDAMSILEVADRLGIGKNQAYEAVRRGEIHAIRIGKRLLVPRVVFERMLEGDK